jgi:hypothetical protein
MSSRYSGSHIANEYFHLWVGILADVAQIAGLAAVKLIRRRRLRKAKPVTHKSTPGGDGDERVTTSASTVERHGAQAFAESGDRLDVS